VSTNLKGFRPIERCVSTCAAPCCRWPGATHRDRGEEGGVVRFALAASVVINSILILASRKVAVLDTGREI
jgi:hypothetical protein